MSYFEINLGDELSQEQIMAIMGEVAVKFNAAVSLEDKGEYCGLAVNSIGEKEIDVDEVKDFLNQLELEAVSLS